MKVRFTARAVGDLARIADFLAPKNPAAAIRVRASIIDSLRLVAAFPDAGRRQNVEGVPKLITRKYGYLVYYSLEQDEVAILTIQQPAQQREFAND